MAATIWRFALEWRYGGTEERMLNVGLVREATGTETQADIADAVANAANGTLTDVVSSDITFMGAHLSGVTLPLADLFTTGIGEAPGGQTGGSGMPRNCCGLVTLNTGVAGKRGRGRLYLPPPNNNRLQIADVTWTSTFAASLGTAVQDFMGALLAGSPALTFGKFTGPNQTLWENYDPVRTIGRQFVGTQRRRINHRGG